LTEPCGLHLCALRVSLDLPPGFHSRLGGEQQSKACPENRPSRDQRRRFRYLPSLRRHGRYSFIKLLQPYDSTLPIGIACSVP
jgi:hypothetical protein